MHTQKDPSLTNTIPASLPNNADKFQQAFQLHQQGQLDQAEVLYEALLKEQPQHIDALHFLGVLANQRGQAQRAADLIKQALNIDVNNAAAHSNLGLALYALKRFDQAVSSYNHALAINPNNADTCANRGNALYQLKHFDEALRSYERALTIKPDIDFILGTWLHLKMHRCEWDNFDYHLNQLIDGIERGKKMVNPFFAHSLFSSAALQKKVAETYNNAEYPSALLLPLLAKHTHSKIKIGYFSSDFRYHAATYLSAELFERHDRSQFEVIAFSFHEAHEKDDMRLRLEAVFDQFIDVSQQSDEQVVQLARELELDIAIDLNGYTAGNRTHIFAMRVAPIQVCYLGYLGTMGADYIDYLLADSTLIPIEHQIYYSEKIAYLPHSFQVNDSTLRIADKIFTRAEFGLPALGFVFCCFNTHYKITPAVFASWMRILHHVEDSVLWLVSGNVAAETNLRLTATAQGIDAKRLVFANTLSMPEHLARHRLADLFLDTNPYNAGATASAALWAGLPLLTYLGETFSGRMAASLLHAIGLPELITTNLDDYEALAIQLATHPEQLAAIKQKLADNRLTYPLFNTALFTQHIERAYQMMFDRYQTGLAPDHIYVLANDAQLPQTMEEQALQNAPQELDPADKFYNEGNALLASQHFEQALAHYDKALIMRPNFAEAYSNRGIALQYLRRLNEALASYDRAVTIKPDYPAALYNRGIILRALNRFSEARSSYEQALAVNPNYEFLFGTWLYMKMSVCDWSQFDAHLNTLTTGIERGEKIAIPFFVQVISSSAALQKKAAEIFVQEKCPSNFLLPPLVKQSHSKIKLAYFSSDFRNHPVSYLMAELFECHDRSKFEIIAFSFSLSSYKDESRLRLEEAFDQFIDVSQQSDEQIVRLARELEIDIAVDLNGFTDGCRVQLFAMRVAPIQVNYLGYASTMNADYIDYLIADSIVIPDEYQPYYSEKIAYLPNSYMVSDSTRLISNRRFTRAEMGLPKQGFVFCCFNNAYKITPPIFDIWMRLLHQVKGSVLWLSDGDADAVNNLRAEASKRGINAERLIFAKRLPLSSEHLARHRLADLFLDTLPYNAHTTTNDALWCGLPVLTCVGETFASRVAASLLDAIGLPELITTSPKDYEALAIQLATHPEQLATLKQKLADNRLTYPLFNTQLFAQHIESAYKAMFDRYQANKAPAHIYVQADSSVPPLIVESAPQNELTPAETALFHQAFEWHQQGQLEHAETLYKQLLQTQPQHADTLHLLGVIAKQRGQNQTAIDFITQALKIDPNNAAAHSNIGLAFQAVNRFEDALASYDRALLIDPDYADALFNQGMVLQNLERLEEALASYDRALTIQPDHAETSFNRGVALHGLKRLDESLASYDRALIIKPDYAEALFNRGNVLAVLKRLDDAIVSYQRALAINPDLEFLHGAWLHAKMNVCDWREFDQQFNQLSQKIAQGEKVCTPFAFQAMSSSAALLKKVACCYTEAKCPSHFLLPALKKHTHSKIRIGYFSSDFRIHPVALLMAELFERHDRARFDVIAFSFSPTDEKDEMRLRLEAAFDQFFDVSQQTDEEIVHLARLHEIDIAIDLNGFTEGGRAIFAMRVAPIQVNYLGYLGTMGAEYMDYLLADPTLIPIEHQAYYTEKVAYLPHSFQVNDSTLRIANKTFTRAEMGLPIQGFVFCCFNSNFKITPAVFDSWMRILQHVKDSVLWLSEDNRIAAKNLRLEAIARGVDPERLVFAKRLPMPDYLARHHLAGLFLDTTPYNAGATASAALWSGLPVLTYLGDTFSSRMGASLLHAIDLPELITNTLKDYEALAIQLATHPEQLATIKQKLADNRLTYPLFNTALFTQHIESAYQAMFDRYQAGLAPDHIYVQTQALSPTDIENKATTGQPKSTSVLAKIAGLMAFTRGRKTKTTPKAKHSVDAAPVQANETKFAQAQRFHQQGQLAAAETLYEEQLKMQPNHTEALRCLDMIKKQREHTQRIVNSSLKINLNTTPASSDKKPSHQNVINWESPALIIDPKAIEALIDQGNELEDLNRLEEALASYDKALSLNLNHARAHSNRGNVLQTLKRFDESIACYERALAIRPDYAEAHYNRGNALQACKHFQEAIVSYDRALAIKPNFSLAFISQINLLNDQGQLLVAETRLRAALVAIPDNLELRFIQLMMTLPIVPKTAADSALVSDRFDHALTDLSNWLENHPESFIKTALLPLPFLLAYRVGNHAQCLSRYGNLVANPSKLSISVDLQKKQQLVIISRHFCRHSVWDVITRGLLEHLDRSRFDLVLYHLGTIEDQETIFAKSVAAKWRDTQTINSLTGWLTALATDAPDVIFYPEIGMDSMTARLAAHRIAPLQIASWGHPITTGLPTIDLYFSGELLESPNADTHYRERLIRLPSTGCCTSSAIQTTFEPLPELESQLATRQGVRFLIAQTVFKFDPADDALYADIASVVGESSFILLRDRDYSWAMDQIVARLEQAFVDRGLNPQQHLLVIPWQTREHFQSLLDLCDVYLDCPSFSGYTTARQAAYRGLPIVTLEGEFMRQRLAAGLLRKIGITDTIASSRDEYVLYAAKLAEECRDPICRNVRRQAFKTAASKADNDVSVVRAFEQSVMTGLANASKPHTEVRTVLANINNTVAIDSEAVEALINQGNELEDLNRLDEALASYDKALSLNPNTARAHSNRGNVLQTLKRFDEAIACYDRALAIRPDYAEAHYNRGNALYACERFQEAIDSYDHALAIKPDFVQALISRGNALHDCKRATDALLSYERALVIQPDCVEALHNRGNVLLHIKRQDEALASYERALAIQPNYVEALIGYGVVLQDLKRFSDAFISYGRALAIKPDLEYTFGDWLYMKMNICDWDNFDHHLSVLTEGIEGDKKIAIPFPLLAMSSSAALQKKAAQSYAEAQYSNHFLLPPLTKHTHKKIKIAYFSSDFYRHPVAYLTAGLFEHHNRSRFEVIAFSFHSSNHKDNMRLRLEAGFDQFINVSQQSDEQVVRLARQMEIDIAVDLNGFTSEHRTNLFAMRVAPVQVSYLGYLGTMGADYMDYLLADLILIPKEHQQHYCEKIAYLPHSFQVNDSTLRIANKAFTRAELGLPEQGFIFCCFNNNYKITPVVFDSWMRILHQIEGSVLWLLGDNVGAKTNLQLTATTHGIKAERLIFAKRVSMPDYLAAHRLADLFLDTSPYNAGATASAALWAGLPIVTYLGETFSGRMGASLLHAIGLPGLVTQNIADYEALAIQLATHPEQLAAIKQKLANNRLTYPLFNTVLFTQHIEAAYQAMFDRYQADLAPEHIYVTAQDNTAKPQPVKQTEPAPDNTDKFQQAMNLHQQGQLAEAEALYEEILQTQPQHIDALHFSGVLANQRGQSQRAVDLIKQALDIDTNNAAAHSNLGLALLALKQFDGALASFDRALNLKPNNAETHYNRASVLLAIKRSDEAIIGFDHALSIKPDYIEALSNRGMALKDLHCLEEALISYERILAIKPDSAEALVCCGIILYDLNRLKEALVHYESAFAIKPDLKSIFGYWLFLKMKLCDWRDFDTNVTKLEQGIEQDEKISVFFVVLAVSSSAALQKKAAICYSKETHPSNFLLPPLVKHAHEKIKLGYFSADFYCHATAHLMAELFENHDRSRFEIIAFVFNVNNDKDDTRLRLEAAFDQFIDVSQQSDEQIAQLARQLEIDIAIDLKGFTEGCRTGIFALRAAPIQVNYLGYPSTMGADYIDYLLADSVLIPTEYQPYYTEKVVYLPNSYQVNDTHRIIANKTVTRAELGLPEQGFVFCCFNNNYKITPAVFDSWMWLLQQVQGSVLWLLEDNAIAANNLRLAATARGIDPERLYFAPRLALPEHLARHRAADLFLDTLPCNAHTTTSDALWAGLPVLTCMGETFASRVAASLLNAIGLPELITTTLEDYEALAIQLATHPEQLAALKQKLADNRLTYPLFNTVLFTQHIESAYQAMFDRYQADLAPAHIYVSDNTAEPAPDNTDKFQQAMNLHQQGQLAEAEALYEDILQTQPQHVDVLHFLGVLKNQRGQAQTAVDLIQQSLALHPNNAAAHSNLGLALQALNRVDDALASYDRALRLQPDDVEILYGRGNLLLTQQRFDDALASYDRALAIQPDAVEILCNRGTALQGLKRLDDALNSYNRALVIKPDYAEAFTNRGNVLRNRNCLNEALTNYDCALAIAPNDVETLTNRGNVLRELNCLDDAVASYNRALSIDPDYAEALCNRGIVLQELNRWDEALASYEQVLSVNPDHEFLFGIWLHLKMRLCDWRDFDNNLNQLEQGIVRGKKISAPFFVQSLSSSAALQKKESEIYAQAKYPSALLLPAIAKHAHSKIKIAYFSADFRHHATAYLMAELFERHDRSRFEIIAFSFHVASYKDDMRLKLEAVFDQFIDVSQQSDEQIAQLARQLEIDIAIDLKGFTEGCRTGIFALRAAPIQVNYLGYPSTMGADYIDYLLADSVLIPTEYQPYYTEKIAYLPNSYQVNDTNRVIANKTVTRAELGLPEQGFVFCCFNNNFKITPTVFDSWMRLLQQVQGSVLWLLEDNATAANNLRLAATAQGIDAERLCFAPRLALPEHLARHRAADLFLDTLPCNAHTTTSDALWAGLPVLTCMGETFASRVAASLLHAIGLPELITTTLEDYEALAIQLATHPEQLAALKQKLADNRLTYPLFNTVLFTQHIEAAYQAMFDRYQADLAPAHIYVSDNTAEPAPDNTDKFQQAMNLHQQGQLAEAEALYEDILQTQPQHVDVLHFLGVLKNQRGQAQRAVDLIQQSLALHPNNAAAHSNLGLALQALNRFDEALINYEKALVINPDVADIHRADTLFGYANTLYSLKRFDEALLSYERSLAINPDNFEVLYNRGVVLTDLNRIDEAIASYQQALTINPSYAEAHNNLATLFKKQTRYTEAQTSYQNALAIKPDYSEAHCNLINLLKDQGYLADAKACLNTALAIIPNSSELRFIKLMMTLPIVPKDAIESALVPSQFDDALTDLAHWLAVEKLTELELLPLPFLLAYRAGNHVKLLSRYGDLVANTAGCAVTTNPTRQKIRMVIVSHHFHRHSVWDVITRGVLVNLDRTRFELILYHLGANEDQETTFAKSLADEWRDTRTMTDLSDCLTAFAIDKPDVIFYPEIGMDPMSAKLAARRIAPLQVTSWGHPITTGLPTIDLYFSGDLLESSAADSHYRERLIRLPSTGCCTTPINISPEPLSPELSAELAVRRGVRFVIAQTIYKFEPADDALYAEIASVVGDSTFILLRDHENAWAMDQIVARLEQTFMDYGLNPKQHLLVIPRQSMEKFQSLLDLCDAYLDCPSFSGYTTAWQAVHRGIPIVTLEGEFMRQRLAAGLLRKIGMTDTIANSREQYVQLAAKLAEESRNPSRYAARRHALKTAAPKADNDVSVVRAFEQSVIAALAECSNLNRGDV